MFAKVASFGVRGIDGFLVHAEADLSGGLPSFSLVGLPDSAVKESGDRVRSALKNLGYTWPVSRITVNLAPADVRKTGPVYDLPVLLAILAAGGQLPTPPLSQAFAGELSLDGSLRPGGTAAAGELGASASRSAADLPFGEEGGVPQPEVPRSIGPEGPSDGGK